MSPETLPPEPLALLELAVKAADAAVDLLHRERPEDLGVAATKSSPTDVVTEMDRASERLIRDILREHRPGDGILGEEGSDDAGSTGVRWIVDPIDGTVNYLYRLPGWSVSIAAERDGQVVAGAVAVPSQDETFTAVLGGGAFRNGQPIRCNSAVPLEGALVATGFSYDARRRARQGVVLAGLLPRIRDIRRYGSAAADLCAVACGRVDAYYEQEARYWDYAAGTLIAREAGARVEGLHRAPVGAELLLAAGPGQFEGLHDLLAASGLTDPL